MPNACIMHIAIVVYQVWGGGDFRQKGNTKVKFESKWRKAPRKFSTILFEGENEGKLFLLPRTPDFYLCS